MKIVIAGSRTISRNVVNHFLDEINFHSDTEIVTGGARGVDTFAHDWAEDQSFKTKVFKAEWDKYGRKAGVLRNIEMAEYGDSLIAIWDGKSRGTEHMINTMIDKHKPLRVCILGEGGSLMDVTSFGDEWDDVLGD